MEAVDLVFIEIRSFYILLFCSRRILKENIEIYTYVYKLLQFTILLNCFMIYYTKAVLGNNENVHYMGLIFCAWSII